MSSLRRLLLRRTLLPLPTTTTTTTIKSPRRAASSSSSSSSSNNNNTSFRPTPAPPRLPASDQAEFERLQRAVADRLADPTPLPHEQASSSSSSATNTTTATAEAVAAAATKEQIPTGVWRGAQPEFQGDTNPKTGEVGGPKTEPLRWGSAGDWSYNGRVTDF